LTGSTAEPSIRLARPGDFYALAAAFEDASFFDDRLRRQQKNRGRLFTAWLDGKPVGIVYLWLERAEERRIRKNLPKVALLTRLEVVDTARNRGIGQALIAAAERYLTELGRDRVALAVRTDNYDATRLYLRLGYVRWPEDNIICYARVALADGRVLRESEECYVMVKDLPRLKSRQRTFAGNYQRLAEASINQA
jgi:GNAT superfamily N-acetyltransferase